MTILTPPLGQNSYPKGLMHNIYNFSKQFVIFITRKSGFFIYAEVNERIILNDQMLTVLLLPIRPLKDKIMNHPSKCKKIWPCSF